MKKLTSIALGLAVVTSSALFAGCAKDDKMMEDSMMKEKKMMPSDIKSDTKMMHGDIMKDDMMKKDDMKSKM